jgi:PAS domain S-box-containing protein
MMAAPPSTDAPSSVSTGTAPSEAAPPKGRACNECKIFHTACDGKRPCGRCIAASAPQKCVDPPQKKRGRPRKRGMVSQNVQGDSGGGVVKPAPITYGLGGPSLYTSVPGKQPIPPLRTNGYIPGYPTFPPFYPMQPPIPSVINSYPTSAPSQDGGKYGVTPAHNLPPGQHSESFEGKMLYSVLSSLLVEIKELKEITKELKTTADELKRDQARLTDQFSQLSAQVSALKTQTNSSFLPPSKIHEPSMLAQPPPTNQSFHNNNNNPACMSHPLPDLHSPDATCAASTLPHLSTGLRHRVPMDPGTDGGLSDSDIPSSISSSSPMVHDIEKELSSTCDQVLEYPLEPRERQDYFYRHDSPLSPLSTPSPPLRLTGDVNDPLPNFSHFTPFVVRDPRKPFLICVKNIPEGGTHGNIVSVNAAFCELFEYKTDEILGGSWRSLVAPTDALRLTYFLLPFTTKSSVPFSPVLSVQARCVTKMGKTFDALVSLQMFFDEEGTERWTAVTLDRIISRIVALDLPSTFTPTLTATAAADNNHHNHPPHVVDISQVDNSIPGLSTINTSTSSSSSYVPPIVESSSNASVTTSTTTSTTSWLGGPVSPLNFPSFLLTPSGNATIIDEDPGREPHYGDL